MTSLLLLPFVKGILSGLQRPGVVCIFVCSAVSSDTREGCDVSLHGSKTARSSSVEATQRACYTLVVWQSDVRCGFGRLSVHVLCPSQAT